MPISFDKFLTENECGKNNPQSEVNKLKNDFTADDHCNKKSRKNLVSFINNSFVSIKTWQKPVLSVDELFNKRQKCKRKEKQQVKVESKPKKKEGKLKSFIKKTFSKTSHKSGHSKHSTTASKGNSNNSLTTNKSNVEIADQTFKDDLKPSNSISKKSVDQDQETEEGTSNKKIRKSNSTNDRYCSQVRNSTSCLSYPNKLKCLSSISFNTGKPGQDFVLERTAECQKRKRNYEEYKLEEMSKVTATMFARTQIEVLYNANTNGMKKLNQFIDDLRVVNS